RAGHARRRLPGLVEPGHQAEPGAGRWGHAAAVAMAGLPAGQPGPAGTATPGMDLCAAALCAQADGGLAAASAVDRLSKPDPRSDIMNTRRRVLFALLAGSAVLAGCASPQVTDYVQQRPKLELDRYFNGRLHAYGLFQKRGGE